MFLRYFFKRFIKRLKRPKRSIRPRFINTIVGSEQFGLITIRWYWNLYEADDGTRSTAKFHGGEIKPNRKTDYSLPAQIDRWLHGGPLPSKIL